jgi:serine/threonine protein kinase
MNNDTTCNIIQLSDQLIIGKGRDRICYEHPLIKTQCIKISIDTHKQSLREVRYLAFLKRKKTDLTYISNFCGKVKTNLGDGYCFELIRDNSGQVAPTLREALEGRITTLSNVHTELEKLKKYLIDNSICVRDISPSNIIYHRISNEIKLIVIDGVSNSNFNPLTIRVKKLTTIEILKSWMSLTKKLTRFK